MSGAVYSASARKAFIALKGDPAEGEWNEVYRLSHSTFRPYAEKHGYDFLPMWYEDVQWSRWPGLIAGRFPTWHFNSDRSHPYWLKIPAIIETLERYDLVLYMDSDCLILDDFVDIELAIPPESYLAMAEVEGYGGKVVSTAVSVTQRCPMAFQFWKEAWESDAYKQNPGWADNAQVAHLLGWNLHPPWERIRESIYMEGFHDLGVEWNAYTTNGGEYLLGCRVYHASGSGDAKTKLGWMKNAIEMRRRET